MTTIAVLTALLNAPEETAGAPQASEEEQSISLELESVTSWKVLGEAAISRGLNLLLEGTHREPRMVDRISWSSMPWSQTIDEFAKEHCFGLEVRAALLVVRDLGPRYYFTTQKESARPSARVAHLA